MLAKNLQPKTTTVENLAAAIQDAQKELTSISGDTAAWSEEIVPLSRKIREMRARLAGMQAITHQELAAKAAVVLLYCDDDLAVSLANDLAH